MRNQKSILRMVFTVIYCFSISNLSAKELKHTVFITGTNRGIGLELVKQYAEEDWTVYATCRDPKNALSLKKLASQHPNIIIQKLDVQSEKEIENLKKQLKGVPIDVVINNAGILGNKNILLENITQKELIDVFSTNAIAPLLISKALTPNLKLGNLKTLVAISSSLSCLSENNCVDWNLYPYKGSKAALNMLMSSYTLERNHSDIRVLLIHPGSARKDIGGVKTNMGGPGAEIEPKDSVLAIRTLILDREKAPTGAFLDYQGNKMPW